MEIVFFKNFIRLIYWVVADSSDRADSRGAAADARGARRFEGRPGADGHSVVGPGRVGRGSRHSGIIRRKRVWVLFYDLLAPHIFGAHEFSAPIIL
jgi:hypothetical protein